jgi:outer membrane protein assembly factor BamB
MREMSASDASREEQKAPMDAVFAPRSPVAFPTERVRRIRPVMILELAAVAVIVLGLVAALNRGWFQNDPEPSTAVPAAILQDDSGSTPATEPEQTSTPAPNTMEPTVVPPGDIPNTIWVLPGTEGESIDFGGLLVDDDTVYRLLATPSFVGVQAIDAETGTVRWQQAHRWAGTLFAIEDDVLYFDGGDNTLTAVDAETGAELWQATVEGNPIALVEDDDDNDIGRIFVLLDTDFVTALNEETGERLWVAQGQVPQNPTGGSASHPATGKIAVENDVVAAISTFGVLTGFDTATGDERWSIDGYDAAMVTILAEDDVFVVSEGLGGFGGGIGAAAGGEQAPEGEESGTGETDAVPASAAGGEQASEDVEPVTGEAQAVPANAAGDACATHFAPGVSTGTVANASGTPEAGTQAVSDAGFRVQAIDPATGEILWEQQAASGGATIASQGGLEAGGETMVCTVDVEHGAVSGAAASAGSAFGVIEVDDDGNQITIGVISGEDFIPLDPPAGDDASSVAILTVPDSGTSSEVMAVAAGDDGVYLQLLDGTLVKVQTASGGDDGGHHEDQDDESSPESESDDDSDDTSEANDD